MSFNTRVNSGFHRRTTSVKALKTIPSITSQMSINSSTLTRKGEKKNILFPFFRYCEQLKNQSALESNFEV